MVPDSDQLPTMASTSPRDRRRMAPHELVAQRLVVEHLPPALGGGVEDDPLAEDGRHERVGLGLVERLLGGPEEELVGLGPGEQHDVAAGQPELADVAALGAGPPHEPDGVAPKLVQMSVLVLAPRDLRRLAQFDVRGHGVLRFGRIPEHGSLGLDFDHRQVRARGDLDHGHHGVGHGVGSEEVAVAGQPPADPLAQDLGGGGRVPVRPHLGQRLSGLDDGGPDPGALELHLQCPGIAFEPPLRRHVGLVAGPGPAHGLRRDEDHVAVVALDHRRQEEADHLVGPDQVHPQRGGERPGRGVDGGVREILAGARDEDVDLPDGAPGVVDERLDRRPTSARSRAKAWASPPWPAISAGDLLAATARRRAPRTTG